MPLTFLFDRHKFVFWWPERSISWSKNATYQTSHEHRIPMRQKSPILEHPKIMNDSYEDTIRDIKSCW